MQKEIPEFASAYCCSLHCQGTDVDSYSFRHMRNRFTMLTCFFPLWNTGWGQKSKKIRKTGVPVELLLLSEKHNGDTPFPSSNYCPLQVSIVCHHQTLSWTQPSSYSARTQKVMWIHILHTQNLIQNLRLFSEVWGIREGLQPNGNYKAGLQMFSKNENLQQTWLLTP